MRGLPNLLCSSYPAAFSPEVRRPGCEVDHHNVAPRLSMSGAIPPEAYPMCRHGMYGDNFVSLKFCPCIHVSQY